MLLKVPMMSVVATLLKSTMLLKPQILSKLAMLLVTVMVLDVAVMLMDVKEEQCFEMI